MALPTYPSIEGVQFSEDDRLFLAHQADKLDLLTGFVVLLAGGSAALQLIGVRITNGKDLGEYLVDRAVDIATDNWGDASKEILQIRFSVALQDVQLHQGGAYPHPSGKGVLAAPTGKALQFFKQLAKYYSDLRADL